MSISGFPDPLDVTLGSAWNGRNGLSNTTVVQLNKVSGQDVWSEDGTTVYNATTNRLMLTFFTTVGSASVSFSVGNAGATQTAFVKIFQLSYYLSAGSPATYTFKDIFNATVPNLTNRNQMYGTPSANYPMTGNQYGTQYATTIFTAMEAGVSTPTIDGVGTAQGTLEVTMAIPVDPIDGVGTGQGTLEAVMSPGKSFDGEGTGQGTLEGDGTHHGQINANT